MWIWAVYLLGLGVILVVAPNALIVPFGFDPTGEVWIRVVGLLVLILAYYSLKAAQTDDRTYMESTVTAARSSPSSSSASSCSGSPSPCSSPSA